MDGYIKRIIIGFFAPSFIGTFLFFIYLIYQSGSLPGLDVIGGYFIGTLFAFIMVGIQSLIYSLIMEFIINREFNNNYLIVTLSCFFGGLAASVYDFELSILTIIGAISGLILGIWLRLMYLDSAKKHVMPE